MSKIDLARLEHSVYLHVMIFDTVFFIFTLIIIDGII